MCKLPQTSQKTIINEGNSTTKVPNLGADSPFLTPKFDV